ncbi:winged helix-turn-helix domain-containing protein [Massilia sp. B-10]|nr:winged helix-turn-helix domain-containing protein [Massilia sp. B-10]
MPASLLVVDADPAAQDLIRLNLTRAGHAVACAAHAEAAQLLLEQRLPDLLLLEWDLAGESGLALVRRLRARPRTRDLAIIMVSARSGEHDKIMALEAGADDYITKPFGPREMIARVHRCCCGAPLHAADDAVQMAGLRLDPGTHRVTHGARQLDLGRVEFRLLNFLMHHPERVHSRAQLLDQVWGSHVFLDERTVDAHVGRLRSALAASGHHDHIETVRGSGYRFVAWDAQARHGWQAA